jgi:chemotaxis protein MotB
MALRRRGGGGEALNPWPGYVDALSTLLMVIIFVLLVFVLAQAFLSVALSGRDRALDRLNRQMAELSDMLSLERGRTSELQLSIAGLNRDLQAASGARDTLRQQLAALQGEQDKLSAERDALKAERDRLSARLADDDLQTQSAQARTGQLQAQIADLAKRGDTIGLEAAATSGQLATSEKQVTALQAQITAGQTALAESRRQLDDTTGKLADTTKQLAATQADLSGARTQIAALQTQNGTSEVALADARRQLADSAGKLADTTKALTATQGQLDASQKQVATLQAQGVAAGLAAAATQRQLDDTVRQLTDARQKLADAQASLLATQKQIDEMRRQRDALDTTVTADRATIQARVSDLAKLAGQVRDLTALRDDLEKQAQDAAVRATTAEQRRAATAVELAEEKKFSDSAKAQLATLTQQVEQLRAQVSSVSKALDIAESQGRDKDVQIANLGTRLNAALAQKVEELQRYRSDFFGRLRQVLANRPGIQVVGDRFVFQSEVLFPVGMADLTPAGQDEIRQLAATLKQIETQIPPDVNWLLRVDGHADRQPLDMGRFRSNWELSAARAITVVRLLIAEGIPPNRLAATGFADYQPLDPADTPDAYAKNRRIEIRLTDR